MSLDQLYCICRQPYTYGAFYLGCDGCNDWLHGECVGINEFDAVRIANYYCPKCREKNISHHKRSSKLSLKRRLPVADTHDGETKPFGRPDAHAIELHPHMTGSEASKVRESPDYGCNLDSTKPPIVGLPNPGGDLCSLNSVVQALLVALPLVNFSSLALKQLQCSTVTKAILNELVSLLETMEKANASLRAEKRASLDDREGSSFAQPHGLALARSLRAANPGRFPSGAQHDAEEVLLSLLAEVDDPNNDLNIDKESSQKDSLEILSKRSLFEGENLSNLECLNCHRKSTRRESYFDVCVHSKGHGDSVLAALQRHWDTTLFSGTDKVKCDNCCDKQDALRTLLPLKLPKVLVVLLRPQATCEHATQRLVKTNREASSIRIDLVLEGFLPEVTDSVKKPDRWMLCAVVMHMGSTFDSGHYTTAIRYHDSNLSSSREYSSSHGSARGSWVLLDDGREVRWLSDDELDDIGLFTTTHEGASNHAAPRKRATFNNSTPYLLFYTAVL